MWKYTPLICDIAPVHTINKVLNNRFLCKLPFWIFMMTTITTPRCLRKIPNMASLLRSYMICSLLIIRYLNTVDIFNLSVCLSLSLSLATRWFKLSLPVVIVCLLTNFWKRFRTNLNLVVNISFWQNNNHPTYSSQNTIITLNNLKSRQHQIADTSTRRIIRSLGSKLSPMPPTVMVIN